MISIRLIYIFILFVVDTKRERKDGTQRKNTTIIQSVYLWWFSYVDFMIVITMFIIVS